MISKRWALVEDFNPGSPKQVLAYLSSQGYKIPRDRKTRKPTSGEEALKEILRTQAPEDKVIQQVLDYRKWQKAEGYLHDTLLGRDGKFHSFFSFIPDTGRLSSVRPNLQNVPNKGVDQEVSLAIRRCIVPSRESRVLVEFDWKAMEAILTGYFAQDPGYIRISELDSHSFFCSYLLHDEGLIKEPASASWEDKKLKAFLADIKARFPLKRFLAKTINLATGYGMGYRLLAATVRCSWAEAKRYLDLKDKMAPLVAKWKEDTWKQAHTEGKLETPFGMVRYFFNVLEKTAKGTFRPGKEAKQALAFRPQSSGASMLREVLLALAERDDSLYWLLVPIHDAILLECEESMVEDVIRFVRPIMERPWPELGGLALKVDVKIGKTWGDMQEED